jgi:hypothetical protein
MVDQFPREVRADKGAPTMSDKNTGPAAGVKGVVEGVKGKAKEAEADKARAKAAAHDAETADQFGSLGACLQRRGRARAPHARESFFCDNAREGHGAFNEEVAMSSEDLHAPRERLTDQTIATHQAIASLMEELQAMDWYRQRADDCGDAELKAVLVHNMNDEMEHAAMLVEWLRRNVAEFATQLDKFVGTKGPIA